MVTQKDSTAAKEPGWRHTSNLLRSVTLLLGGEDTSLGFFMALLYSTNTSETTVSSALNRCLPRLRYSHSDSMVRAEEARARLYHTDLPGVVARDSRP